MELTQSNKRNNTIDILKGCCIIFMVAGHASCPNSSYLTIFHMSVFFMASGFFYNPQRIIDRKTFFSYFKRKLATLWLPFVIYNAIFLFIRPFLFKLNLLTTNHDIINYGLFSSPSNLWSLKYTCYKLFEICLLRSTAVNITGAFWFVGTLFYIQILYSIFTLFINYFNSNFSILTHFIIQFFISFIFLTIGWMYKTHTPLFILYYSLFHLGLLVRYINIQKYICTSIRKILCTIISFIVIKFLLIDTMNFNIDLVTKTFNNPLALIITAFIGWTFCYSLSLTLEYIPILNNFFSFTGKNTMEILALHILSFKLIALLKILPSHRPLYLLAAFPALEPNGLWWLWYTLAGISFPLFASILIKKTEFHIKTYIKNNLSGDKKIEHNQ